MNDAALTFDHDVWVEGGDPLGGDALLVRVEVVEVPQGGGQAEAEGNQQHWEPHHHKSTALSKNWNKM